MTEPITRIEMYYAIEHAFGEGPPRASDLMAEAISRGARPDVIHAIATLPSDRTFRRIRDVWEYYPDMPTGAIGDN